MTDGAGPSWILRSAQWMIERACRRLPGTVRDERVREQTGEMPSILTNPPARFARARAVKALLFAVGVARVAGSLCRSAGSRHVEVPPEVFNAVRVPLAIVAPPPRIGVLMIARAALIGYWVVCTEAQLKLVLHRQRHLFVTFWLFAYWSTARAVVVSRGDRPAMERYPGWSRA